MHIEHILEQGSGAHNEDSLLMDNGIFGVFDGATSIDATVFEQNQTGGQLASTIAGEVFARNHVPLHTLGAQANTAIRDGMDRRGVDVSQRCSLWSTSAAVLRLRDETLEWFQTGDAQVVLIDEDGSFRVPARRMDHDYPTLAMIREKGRFHPEVRRQIESVREGMNREYGVLNGEPEAEHFFQSGSVSLHGLSAVLLFTDGLDLPCSTPRQFKNFSPLVRMACTHGLQGVRDHIRALEASDPDITCYPRFKCHDDIAAIAIHF